MRRIHNPYRYFNAKKRPTPEEAGQFLIRHVRQHEKHFPDSPEHHDASDYDDCFFISVVGFIHSARFRYTPAVVDPYRRVHKY